MIIRFSSQIQQTTCVVWITRLLADSWQWTRSSCGSEVWTLHEWEVEFVQFPGLISFCSFISSCVHLCSPVSCWLISLVLAVCVLPCRLVSHGLFSGFCSSCISRFDRHLLIWRLRFLVCTLFSFYFSPLYLSFSSDQTCSRLPPEGLAFGSPLSATHHTPLPRGVHPSAFEGFCPAYMMVTF